MTAYSELHAEAHCTELQFLGAQAATELHAEAHYTATTRPPTANAFSSAVDCTPPGQPNCMTMATLRRWPATPLFLAESEATTRCLRRVWERGKEMPGLHGRAARTAASPARVTTVSYGIPLPLASSNAGERKEDELGERWPQWRTVVGREPARAAFDLASPYWSCNHLNGRGLAGSGGGLWGGARIHRRLGAGWWGGARIRRRWSAGWRGSFDPLPVGRGVAGSSDPLLATRVER